LVKLIELIELNKFTTAFFRIFFGALFFCFSLSSAQVIKGNITDVANEPISLVMVQLLDKDEKILQYRYTSEAGTFEFKMLKDTDKIVFLLVQSLFYEEQRIAVSNQDFFSIILTESNQKLNEIVVKAQKISNDTLALGLGDRNIDRNDKVEDALRKIPGISVAKDGKIFYFNKEIQKILIDGDDLAGSQYTFISRNLRAEVLKEIEVLKNYEENTILRNVQNSNRIALNLKLKDAYKNVVFGNIDAIYGNDFKENQQYKATSTVSLLNSKVKLLGAARYSTLGDRAIQEQLGEINDKQTVMDNKPFYAITSINTPLPEIVSNFNEAASTTFLINKKVGGFDLRSTNYVGKDNIYQFYKRTTIFPFQNESALQEDFVNNSQILKFQGDFTFSNRNANRYFFKNTTLYDATRNNGLSNLQVGNQFISDDINQRSFKISNLNELTTLLNNNLIIESYVNLGFDKSNENVSIQSSEQLFPTRFIGTSIFQQIDRTNAIIDAGSSSRIQLNDNSFFKIGLNTSYNSDHFKNESNPVNLGFDFDEGFNRLSLKLPITYGYKIKQKTTFIAKASPRFNTINRNSFYLLDYTARLDATYMGNWSLEYSRKNTLPLNNQLINGAFIAGTNAVIDIDVAQKPIRENVLSVYHNIRNSSNSLENSITLRYSRASAILLSNSTLEGNFNIIDLDFINQEQNVFSLKEQLVWLVDSYGLNFTTNHSLLRSPIPGINNLTSSIITNTYDLKINSYYNSGLNFEVQVAYNRSVQKFENNKNSFESYSLELDISYELNKELDFTFTNFTSRIDATNYSVLNLEGTYVPENKSYTLATGVFNLLDEDAFVTQFRDTFFFSTTTIPLRTRLPYIKYTYTF
jgi:hypothetical protein